MHSVARTYINILYQLINLNYKINNKYSMEDNRIFTPISSLDALSSHLTVSCYRFLFLCVCVSVLWIFAITFWFSLSFIWSDLGSSFRILDVFLVSNMALALPGWVCHLNFYTFMHSSLNNGGWFILWKLLVRVFMYIKHGKFPITLC